MGGRLLRGRAPPSKVHRGLSRAAASRRGGCPRCSQCRPLPGACRSWRWTRPRPARVQRLYRVGPCGDSAVGALASGGQQLRRGAGPAAWAGGRAAHQDAAPAPRNVLGSRFELFSVGVGGLQGRVQGHSGWHVEARRPGSPGSGRAPRRRRSSRRSSSGTDAPRRASARARAEIVRRRPAGGTQRWHEMQRPLP